MQHHYMPHLDLKYRLVRSALIAFNDHKKCFGICHRNDIGLRRPKTRGVKHAARE